MTSSYLCSSFEQVFCYTSMTLFSSHFSVTGGHNLLLRPNPPEENPPLESNLTTAQNEPKMMPR